MLRRILTFTGYLSLTLLVFGVTFALVAYGNDYAYDFSTHRIIQKGHIIIGTSPNGVALSADGRALGKKTPYQAAYKVGAHTFELVKDGFWPWKKTLEVVAGEVNLARYVILVPKTPQKTDLDSHPQIVAQSMSKDHRHLAYITGGADSALYTLDLGNPKPVKLYSAKIAVPSSTPAEVLTGVKWSDDASHLLITSTLADQPVYRLAAASGGEPSNLTAQYGFNFASLTFSASNWKQLYWISPEGLRRLDIDGQPSAVLADKVSQFWVLPDHVLYVQQTDLGRSLWSLDSHSKHQELIQALPESDSYSMAGATYLGEDELAIVPSKTQVGTLYSGIYGDTPVAKTVARGVTGTSFSPDGHFVAFSSPTTIATYDLDQSAITSSFVIHNITDQPGTLTALTWFDNFHLLTTRDGHLYWSEFDGANRVYLGSVANNFPGYGTSDFRSIVMFGTAGSATHVTQLQIKQ